MSSVTTHSKPADTSSHKPNPERMRQLVSENVNQNRTWETEESDQPQNCAQREKPKFLARPEPLRYGRARERGKKCLTKNCTQRQQEDRKYKLHPASRNQQWFRRSDEPSGSRARNASDNFPTALRFARAAIVFRSSLRCSQSCPQITQTYAGKSKKESRGLQNLQIPSEASEKLQS